MDHFGLVQLEYSGPALKVVHFDGLGPVARSLVSANRWLRGIKITGKNNGFPFLDIFGYLKNTHKNPKFGRVRQVPIWKLGWEFPGWDLSHFAKFGIFMGIL